mgnify:CR=1 FL=1
MDGRWTTLISIHALREEGDSGTVANYSKTKAISIHALREEGDLAGLEVTSFERQFLSTPSARRATRSSIVYHFSWSFLSTPSARRATTVSAVYCTPLLISIHALREEGDSLRP